MTNLRQITPISFWFPTGQREADHILLYNFHAYNFDSSDSMVSYKLVKVTERTVQVALPQAPGILTEEQFEEKIVQDLESIYEGSISIPHDVVQEWGKDDEPIFDFVISQLNLTKVEE